MTIKEIENEYNRVYNIFNERTVDICVYEFEGNVFVTVVGISENHIVWKRWFYIENGELHFIKCECM